MRVPGPCGLSPFNTTSTDARRSRRPRCADRMSEAVDLLLEPWRSGIGQRALLEVVLVGAIGGALGFWVTTFGLAYGAESLAHGLLPGLVAAALLGAPLFAGAVAGALIAAVAVAAASRDTRVGPDTATAVAVSGLLGGGGIMAFAPAVPPRLGDILFGDPLSVTSGDLTATAVLVAVGCVALAVLHRPLAAVALGGEATRSIGVRPGAVLVALLVVLALTLAVAVQGLGNLLVLAVLIGPAVAVRRHARSPARAMAGGATVAIVAGVAGLYASHHLEIAAGAAVALALCVSAAVGSALPPRRPRTAT